MRRPRHDSKARSMGSDFTAKRNSVRVPSRVVIGKLGNAGLRWTVNGGPFATAQGVWHLARYRAARGRGRIHGLSWLIGSPSGSHRRAAQLTQLFLRALGSGCLFRRRPFEGRSSGDEQPRYAYMVGTCRMRVMTPAFGCPDQRRGGKHAVECKDRCTVGERTRTASARPAIAARCNAVTPS